MMPTKPRARAGGLKPPAESHSTSNVPGVSQPTDGGCKPPAQAPHPPPSVFFNREAPVRRYRNWLPHWRQPGKWYFVTFRLADSLAQVTLKKWAEERATWLQFHPQPWSEKVEQEYHRRFTAQFERWLDAGEGECLLRREELRNEVVSALHHFAADCAGGLQPPSEPVSSSSAPEVLEPTDGGCKPPARDTRYELGDFVVMPNHVHVLVRPLGEWDLEQVLHSWKRFSASAMNRLLARRGPVWWKDNFDHLVRSAEKFAKFQRYIADNPTKANLRPGEYHHYRASLCYLNTPP